MGIGRCPDRPGAPERLVRGDGAGYRHRDRRMPGQPAPVAPLALLALRHVLGLASALPWARACRGRPSPCPRKRRNSSSRDSGDNSTHWRRAARACFRSPTLGLGPETRDFQARPVIEAIPTHISTGGPLRFGAVVRIVVLPLGAVVAPVVCSALRITRDDAVRSGDAPAPAEPAHAGAECATTAFYLWSMIAIPGVMYLMTIDVYFYHFYYFVLCPFVFVLIAMCMLPWEPRSFGPGACAGPDELSFSRLYPPDRRDQSRGVWLELCPAGGIGEGRPIRVDSTDHAARAHAVAPAARSRSIIRSCPRRVAQASGVAHDSSSARLVGAPRASRSSTMSGRLLRAAQAERSRRVVFVAC